MILRVPATSGIITSNDGAITYAEITGEGLATDAYTQAVINSQGLTFLNTSILDYCAVYNGAVKTVNDDGTFNITLPFTISGFSTTPNATESDSGLSVGSTITYDEIVSALNLYAVPASTSRKSVDLTTLTGWEALSSGTHNITVVAKADGYRDSEPSEAVQVTKAGHTLTFNLAEASTLTINGVSATSPATITTGDVIVVTAKKTSGADRSPSSADVIVTYDGKTETITADYSTGDVSKTINITAGDMDIVAQATTKEATATLTIYYTEGGAASGETWLLNETISPYVNTDITYTAYFQSNGQTYSEITYGPDIANITCLVKYDNTQVYLTDTGWSNEAYRTITFETAPTGDLLTWLQANATKQ